MIKYKNKIPERAHPNAPLCKMSCLYDKMHTPSWILHDSVGLNAKVSDMEVPLIVSGRCNQLCNQVTPADAGRIRELLTVSRSVTCR